jgi:hypothetical protein
MIDECFFTNAHTGEVLYFNDDEVPFRTFVSEVEVLIEKRKKAFRRGHWKTRSSKGERIFRVEGDVLRGNSQEYIDKVRTLRRVLNVREGEPVIGTLSLQFTGMPERIESEVTIEGWPELPIEALSPSRGTYMIAWKAFNPALLGAIPNYTDIAFSELAGGRTYAKTYPYDYNEVAGDARARSVFVGGDEDTYPSFRFTGPALSPRVQIFFNDGTFSRVELEGLYIPAGDYVDVDFEDESIVNSSGSNMYGYAENSVWGAFPANETITVRYLPDFGGSMRLSWRNAYTL